MSDFKNVLIKGSAKKVEFDNGGYLYNIDFRVSQLQKILDWANKERKKRGLESTEYLKVTLRQRKDGKADEFGNTHFLTYDPWFPEPKGGDAPSSKPEEDDDLPF